MMTPDFQRTADLRERAKATADKTDQLVRETRALLMTKRRLNENSRNKMTDIAGSAGAMRVQSQQVKQAAQYV